MDKTELDALNKEYSVFPENSKNRPSNETLQILRILHQSDSDSESSSSSSIFCLMTEEERKLEAFNNEFSEFPKVCFYNPQNKPSEEDLEILRLLESPTLVVQYPPQTDKDSDCDEDLKGFDYSPEELCKESFKIRSAITKEKGAVSYTLVPEGSSLLDIRIAREMFRQTPELCVIATEKDMKRIEKLQKDIQKKVNNMYQKRKMIILENRSHLYEKIFDVKYYPIHYYLNQKFYHKNSACCRIEIECVNNVLGTPVFVPSSDNEHISEEKEDEDKEDETECLIEREYGEEDKNEITGEEIINETEIEDNISVVESLNDDEWNEIHEFVSCQDIKDSINECDMDVDNERIETEAVNLNVLDDNAVLDKIRAEDTWCMDVENDNTNHEIAPSEVIDRNVVNNELRKDQMEIKASKDVVNKEIKSKKIKRKVVDKETVGNKLIGSKIINEDAMDIDNENTKFEIIKSEVDNSYIVGNRLIGDEAQIESALDIKIENNDFREVKVEVFENEIINEKVIGINEINQNTRSKLVSKQLHRKKVVIENKVKSPKNTGKKFAKKDNFKDISSNVKPLSPKNISIPKSYYINQSTSKTHLDKLFYQQCIKAEDVRVDKYYGNIAGIFSGQLWRGRKEVVVSEIHKPAVAAICGGPLGVISMILNDICVVKDEKKVFLFYGPKEKKPSKKEIQDTTFFNEVNNALYNSWRSEMPIRVTRSHKLNSQFAPKMGYRYDGLYNVTDWQIESSDTKGFVVPVFAFQMVSSEYKRREPCKKEPQVLSILRPKSTLQRKAAVVTENKSTPKKARSSNQSIKQEIPLDDAHMKKLVVSVGRLPIKDIEPYLQPPKK